MKSGSFGEITLADEKTCNDYKCIDNDCADCLYSAGKIATTDVLAAIIENELTPTEKKAINLYWFKRMKINKIAAVTGVSETSVRKSLARAQERIRKIMKYIVLYDEMLSGTTLMPADFKVKIIRCDDGKELIPQ